jgi:hypothetical protein
MSYRSKRGKTIPQGPMAVKPSPPNQHPLTLAMQRAAHERWPCLLCRAPMHAVGVFVPRDPQAWSCAPGIQAGCVYTLCQACMALPDKADHVEHVLWEDEQSQRLVHNQATFLGMTRCASCSQP